MQGMQKPGDDIGREEDATKQYDQEIFIPEGPHEGGLHEVKHFFYDDAPSLVGIGDEEMGKIGDDKQDAQDVHPGKVVHHPFRQHRYFETRDAVEDEEAEKENEIV